MQEIKNYYEILGLEFYAEQKEILKAYRDFAKMFSKKKITLEKFNEVQEAFDVLSDEDKRNIYDEVFLKTMEEQINAEEIEIVLDEELESKDETTNEETNSDEVLLETKEEQINAEETETVSDEELLEANDETVDEETNTDKVALVPVKNLRVNENWFKRNRGKLITTSLVLAAFIVGLLIGGKKDNKKQNNTSNQSTNGVLDITESTVPENTVAPEVSLMLNAENYEEIVNNMIESNEAKGMPVIDKTVIRSALFITNIDYLTKEDVKAMYGDEELNIVEEINNFYQYISAVRTHNGQIRNYQIEDFEIEGKSIVDKTTDKYISLSDLAYDEEDKAILKELDAEYFDLIVAIKSKTLTSTDFQTSFSYITGFYTGSKELTTNEKSYSIHSATQGGGLLAEAYWPMFGVTYGEVEEFYTKENATAVKSLVDVVDGERFLSAIVNHENLNCSEKQKIR